MVFDLLTPVIPLLQIAKGEIPVTASNGLVVKWFHLFLKYGFCIQVEMVY